jgi:hypothetical protein
MMHPPLTFRNAWSSWLPRLAASLFLVAIVPARAGAQPPSSPSRLLPSGGLDFYVEYDGLSGHEKAWKATAAYDILGGTPSGAMLADVTRQLLDQLSRLAPDRKFSGSEMIAIEQHLVTHGIAVAEYDEDGSTSTVFVLKTVGKQDPKLIELVRRYILMPDKEQPLPPSTSVRGRALFKFGDQQDSGREAKKEPEVPKTAGDLLGTIETGPPKRLTAWFEGNDLIIVLGPNDELLAGKEAATSDLTNRHRTRVAAVLDAVDGKQANVSTHPAYIAASTQGRDLAGFEANGLFLAEPGKTRNEMLSLFHLNQWTDKESFERLFFQTFGLQRARRVVGRWGFRGKSLLTDVRFEAPEPWKRVGEMLNPARLRKDRLPPIPEGAGAFALGSFRQADLRESLAPLWRVVKDDLRPIFEAAEEAIVDKTTRAFREEVRRHLGPTWCVYASPSARLEANGSADPAFLIEVEDAEATAKLLDEVISRANAYFREQRPGDGRPAMAFERLPSPERGYRLTSPAGNVPWLTDQLQPTVLLGKSFIAAAGSPALARAAIAGETNAMKRFKPADELTRSLDCLPEKLSLLIVGNPRDSVWPAVIAGFPAKASPFVQMFFGLPLGALPDEEEAPASDLLGLLGVPRPQSIKRRADHSKLPTADELRARLFPSVIAAIVDDRNFRLIALEAVPFACLGPEVTFSENGRTKTVEIDVKFHPGK